MAYLHCGRCGLRVKIQANYLRIDNCPRCLARSGTIAPMTVSANGVRHAVGWGTRAPDLHDQPHERGEPIAAVDTVPTVRRPSRPRTIAPHSSAQTVAAVDSDREFPCN
jgi:hypothetical protein